MSNFRQVKNYLPYLRHPEKYINKSNKNLRAMSGLEMEWFVKFDNNSNVLRWASEEVIINYPRPIFESKTGKIIKYEKRRYITDVWLYMKNHKGEMVEIIGEIKPISQVEQPQKPERNTPKAMKRYINNYMIWTINQMKWKYAIKAVEEMRKRGKKIYFQILTENKIFEY